MLESPVRQGVVICLYVLAWRRGAKVSRDASHEEYKVAESIFYVLVGERGGRDAIGVCECKDVE